MQLLIRRGNPIRKRLDSEVMLLVIFRNSSVAVVETSREPYTKNVGFRSHVAYIFLGLLALQMLTRRGKPYTKKVGLRSNVACNFYDL